MSLFDDMELGLATPAMSDEEILEADLITTQDTANFEGERCGLCMDLIIDRGVLDCCQHWFCFTCIDNWATITNLCPLCQSEFQLITCVPVYDTVGSNKFEEEQGSREDDWCVEGKNNTLSFPSYYIDENAVVCLDGDDCKVRSGSASAEGDSYLDTSIACDSCDIWYHASCVGFDPEGTSENTWLCPRCVAHQMQNDLSLASLQESGNIWCPGNVGRDYMVDDALCGKVSVAVADAGETAIVVSMVQRDLQIEMPNENPLNVEVDEAIRRESMALVADANIRKVETETVENRATDPEPATQNVVLSLSQDTCSVIPPASCAFSELKPNNDENAANELSTSGCQDVIGKLFSKSNLGMKTSEWQNTDGTKIETDDATNNQTGQDFSQTTVMEDSTLDANNTAPDAEKVPAIQTCAKRKHTSSRAMHVIGDTAVPKAEIKTEVVPKKRRLEENVEVDCFEDQTDTLVSDDTKKSTILADVADKFSNNQETPPDIMNIVKGTGRKSSATDKTSARGENAGGLRIKKIMRTAGKDEEKSILVQKLRKEIREAVQNKSSKDLEENLVDAKLLAAFRAVIAGPRVEPVEKLTPLAVKAKKSLLQKGKVRESLTKKIYGSSNGRRKRAWDRDCEVEFWKYRCMRATKPEKIETLKSVLGLLRGNSTNLEIMQEPDQPSSDSILSRLYLADTSVLPRKDDIKPLSYLEVDSEQKKEQIIPGGRSVDHGIKGPSSKHNAPVSKVPARRPEGSSVSHLNSSNCGKGKDMVSKSDDLKRDKRKWALEILARKTASAGTGATSDEHEDNAILKGNFPLLAQLPKDMRPVLASTRHNKVPKSVRQKQLYRLTEHFLRNANLQTLCRTAETELAVADAINIEREVADRSNSKLVYINLCSQEIMHCAENSKSSGAIEPTSLSPLAVPTEKPEQGTEEYSDPEVEVALRAAGLLSDSPPNTPSLTIGVLGEEKVPSAEAGEEVHDNITQAGCDSETDIYGEFENNLGDKDDFGNGPVKVPEQPEEEEGLSKTEGVFLSSNSENLDHALDSKPSEVSLSECCECASIRTSPEEDVGNEPSDSHKFSCGHVGELPSVRECEELYGPDKEPLMNKLSVGVGGTECDLTDKESRNGIGIPGDVKTCEPSREVEQSAGVFTHHKSSGGKKSSSKQEDRENRDRERSDDTESIKRKVEAYIKEHIRPLCKSGVISVEQYRWAVAKSVEKVMKYHHKAKNANFLIKEGEKVKRLAEQYVEASQQRGKTDPL
ncbi:uncharacterized protein At4g10930 isoform X2 [Rhodamnia argentea]|uniref:Uncharacterized protein At4g10930 isoform X2 n=1 Tax=Rhodamnia argentea TaxID=178133 RepID=A0A8B8PZJ6_9MYRT|nr:uncharacterized protein At4g10930 isoform X2 [Rhodamnia argentea]